jgi:tRNA 2-thiouridine synthesizing protein E
MVTELSDKEKQELVLGIHEDDETKAFRDWTEAQAEARAQKMGLSLTDEHWQVIRFLRVQFENAGSSSRAHEVAEALEERFASEGGLKYMYRLFPGGPVTQGCELAGVPVPSDSTNPSFGSVT